MEHRVKDSRGKVPNYVIEGMIVRHQPTGLTVELPGKSKRQIARAHAKLKAMVNAAPSSH